MHKSDIPAWAVARGKAVHDYSNIDPRRTALIVIDLQNFFMEPGQPMANPHALDIVTNVNRIARALRGAGGKVLFTQHSFGEADTSHEKLKGAANADSDFVRNLRQLLVPGKPGYDLHRDLDVDPNDVIIVKRRASAFHPYAQTDLKQILDEAGIDTLIVTGCVTNGCCETTARDAHGFNYRVVFVSDGNAAMTDEEHNATLLNLRCYFADVQTAAELSEAIDRAAAGAERRPPVEA
ncbi:MAG: isochorismatase family cysteine hydrolase [Phenylobacterium sp.]